MFSKGDYIVAGNNGICKISEITHLDMQAANKDKLYYILVPVDSPDRKIYSPVDNDRVVMRNILSREEAEDLIDSISQIEQYEDRDYREDEYREIMKSCDCTEWIKIIKTLYNKKKTRIASGKKATVTDEKYLKMAEDRLYSELAFAIGKEKSEFPKYIKEKCGKTV